MLQELTGLRVAELPDIFAAARMGLGENIHRRRLEGGHRNAAAFAREIGVSPGTLGDWEKGRYTKLRLDNLLRIAKAIPCTIDELLEGVDADYDAVVIGRAESTQGTFQKKNGSVTTPVTQDEAQWAPTYAPTESADIGGPQTPPGRGEATLGTQTSSRVQESETADALRRLHLLKQILDATNTIRAAVDGLGTRAHLESSPTPQSEHPTRHPHLRRRTARHRGGRS